ncbi:uncharacterized protein [Nicotiana tomentosiformis]|uniref:uncharacterized protein n=1 Tax=Nicotiana tomentosiformis TaxID=4098 RepID=UPI00388CA935
MIFVNLPFQDMLTSIEVEHLIRTGSDHAPLLMTCGDQTLNFVKPFRVLNFWTKHATFMDVVRQNWNADFIGDRSLMFKHKLKKVKATLSKWSRDTFGDIFKQLAILEDIVKKAQSELKKYLSIEEQYWKQKDGMTWFGEGDRNIIFFHNYVNGKRKKLQLKRIQYGDGTWLEDQDQMAIDANLELCRFPTLEEVKAAVFELSGDSVSGPDGFTAEVLSRSLKKMFEDKSFVGFGMPKWSDPLNHLAYIDDTLIFASAHPPSLIMAVLGGYE